MKKLSTETKVLAIAALAVGGLVWWTSRKVAGITPGTVAQTAVGWVESAAVGTVKGIGSVFGIPDTNKTQCERDMAAGNWWDASFSCPAGTFISGGVGAVFGSTNVSAAAAADAAAVEAAKARAQFALIDPRRVDNDPFRGMAPEEYRMYSGGTW